MEVKQGEGENDHYLRIKAISMLDQFYSSTHPYIHSSCHWCQDWWSLWLSIYNCIVVNGKRFMATSHNGFFFFLRNWTMMWWICYIIGVVMNKYPKEKGQY